MNILYSTKTGQILMTTTSNRPLSEMPLLTEPYTAYAQVSSADLDTQLRQLDTGAIVSKSNVAGNGRTIKILDNGSDTAVFSNLPNDATYTIYKPDGGFLQEGIVNSSKIAITSDKRGVFRIEIEHGLHLPGVMYCEVI